MSRHNKSDIWLMTTAHVLARLVEEEFRKDFRSNSSIWTEIVELFGVELSCEGGELGESAGSQARSTRNSKNSSKSPQHHCPIWFNTKEITEKKHVDFHLNDFPKRTCIESKLSLSIRNNHRKYTENTKVDHTKILFDFNFNDTKTEDREKKTIKTFERILAYGLMRTTTPAAALSPHVECRTTKQIGFEGVHVIVKIALNLGGPIDGCRFIQNSEAAKNFLAKNIEKT